MSLQEKILRLKMDAVIAAKHAAFWQRTIDTYGEPKALAFYEHLGLNHLEKKSYEWEGLKLSREPKEHEKIAVKGIHQAQESAKESINKILIDLRTELISDGLKGIKKLKPASYHELILQASPDSRQSLRDRLVKVYNKGRRLVESELSDAKLTLGKSTAREYLQSKATEEDEFEDLDLLTDLTNGRVVNDVASRIVAAAQRFSLLGQTGNTLLTSITSEITTGSVSYIDQTAAGTSHKVIGIGRADEMRERSDSIDHYEYSALLDLNTCEACFPLDGTTAQSMDELPETPLEDCLGGLMCRCFILAVAI